MADQEKNISDVEVKGGIVPRGTPASAPQFLPIRKEKQIIPTPVSPTDAANVFQKQLSVPGNPSPAKIGRMLVERQDFYLKAALAPYIDYVYIRLPHRGENNSPAVYRFLINPQQVAVHRQTIDGQSMTRGGWQIGVWGEDCLSIQINGKTAGQYWSFGLTDRYEEFSESYRNLLMLQTVFENNGYWFEGENAGGWFNRSSRRIKMHSDVELIVGNYAWYGMFESLTVTQTADSPWLANFAISFTAWKERFRPGSPYQNLIRNDVQRGHAYQEPNSVLNNAVRDLPLSTSSNLTALSGMVVQPEPLAPQPVSSAVSVSEAESMNREVVTNTASNDYSPVPTLGNMSRLGLA